MNSRILTYPGPIVPELFPVWDKEFYHPVDTQEEEGGSPGRGRLQEKTYAF